MLFLILGLLIGSVAVIFALQNVVTINVTFLAWQLDGPLSLILLMAVATGILVCILVSIPEVIKNHIEFSVLKKQNKRLEDENANFQRILNAAGTKVTETKVVESQTSVVQ